MSQKPIEGIIAGDSDNTIFGANETKQNISVMSTCGRILLVDDNTDIITTLEKALMLAGFEVEAYHDSEKALSRFKQDAYDLAILDVRMPKMNGFELCRKIRKRDEKIKVCFMTAFEIHPEEFEKVLPSIKADGFITKPISVSSLSSTVQRLLCKGNGRAQV